MSNEITRYTNPYASGFPFESNLQTYTYNYSNPYSPEFSSTNDFPPSAPPLEEDYFQPSAPPLEEDYFQPSAPPLEKEDEQNNHLSEDPSLYSESNFQPSAPTLEKEDEQNNHLSEDPSLYSESNFQPPAPPLEKKDKQNNHLSEDPSLYSESNCQPSAPPLEKKDEQNNHLSEDPSLYSKSNFQPPAPPLEKKDEQNKQLPENSPAYESNNVNQTEQQSTSGEYDYVTRSSNDIFDYNYTRHEAFYNKFIKRDFSQYRDDSKNKLKERIETINDVLSKIKDDKNNLLKYNSNSIEINNKLRKYIDLENKFKDLHKNMQKTYHKEFFSEAASFSEKALKVINKMLNSYDLQFLKDAKDYFMKLIESEPINEKSQKFKNKDEHSLLDTAKAFFDELIKKFHETTKSKGKPPSYSEVMGEQKPANLSKYQGDLPSYGDIMGNNLENGDPKSKGKPPPYSKVMDKQKANLANGNSEYPGKPPSYSEVMGKANLENDDSEYLPSYGDVMCKQSSFPFFNLSQNKKEFHDPSQSNER
ncbi:hypothetical protein L3V83_05290 [Thiotrichales bacterium 19X7-9]|nr:hypothetical protein [Thiotrichales bacterium 19X7-9]